MKFNKIDKDSFRPYDITFTVETLSDNNVLRELTQDPTKLKVMQSEKVLAVGAGAIKAQTCTDLPWQQQTFLRHLSNLIRD